MAEIIIKVSEQFLELEKAEGLVTEVIRCKDCKEYAEWGDSTICMRHGSYYGSTNPNDFCSRAERKEE